MMEDFIPLLSLVSPVVAVVLGGVAMVIARRYYLAGKEAQREARQAMEAVRERTDVLRSNLVTSASVTAYFYAALANIHIQSRLRKQNADPNPRLVSLLEQSYIDFTNLGGMIDADKAVTDRFRDLCEMAKKFRRQVRSWESFHALDKKKSGAFRLPGESDVTAGEEHDEDSRVLESPHSASSSDL
jgi:hypothetical protein